jgi:hypothetical protein
MRRMRQKFLMQFAERECSSAQTAGEMLLVADSSYKKHFCFSFSQLSSASRVKREKNVRKIIRKTPLRRSIFVWEYIFAPLKKLTGKLFLFVLGRQVSRERKKDKMLIRHSQHSCGTDTFSFLVPPRLSPSLLSHF